jgi:hypothetical protein
MQDISAWLHTAYRIVFIIQLPLRGLVMALRIHAVSQYSNFMLVASRGG